MALNKETVIAILELKHQDENNRNRKVKKGTILLSNRDIAETVLGSRSSESTVRRVWAEYKKKGHYRGITVEGGLAGGIVDDSKVFRKKAVGKKFVLTSVQNNTLLHEDFFNTLLNYCEHNGAELMVSGFYYNKNGFQNGKRDGAWFDERVIPFMGNDSVELAKGLVWSAELNILPTAQNPISGFHNYNNDASFIIPHAKLCLESVPTPKMDEARLIYTTGTCSLRNYRNQKAGAIADHHHSFSALVVEVDDDGDWFVRQLNCESKTGNFYDLDKYYTPNSVEEGCTIEAVNYGDIHAAKLDPVIANLSWLSKASILDTLKPKYQFVHDVFDAQARNHHNVKDSHFLFNMFINQTENLRDEVRATTEVLESMKRDFSEVVVVESNHDLALFKFLKEQDYRKDPVNAVFFLEMQLATYKAIENKQKDYSCFEYACHMVNPSVKDGVRFLRTDEPFRICGDIECGQHGHNSSGGARGNVKSFAKQGLRFNTGHTHAVSIHQGTYTAGVSGYLDMGYNVGGSSWSQSHLFTYSNGKRTIITCKNGKWKG
jgi:hypothetical protein